MQQRLEELVETLLQLKQVSVELTGMTSRSARLLTGMTSHAVLHVHVHVPYRHDVTRSASLTT